MDTTWLDDLRDGLNIERIHVANWCDQARGFQGFLQLDKSAATKSGRDEWIVDMQRSYLRVQQSNLVQVHHRLQQVDAVLQSKDVAFSLLVRYEELATKIGDTAIVTSGRIDPADAYRFAAFVSKNDLQAQAAVAANEQYYRWLESDCELIQCFLSDVLTELEALVTFQ